MKKYRTPKWPFFCLLLAGLTCSLAVPEKNAMAAAGREKEKSLLAVQKTAGTTTQQKGDKKIETYHFGPQLLIALP